MLIGPHPAIRRITANGAKPGRGDQGIYLIQMTKNWSRDHLEETPGQLGEQVSGLLAKHFPSSRAELLFVHRWRYAFTEVPLGQPCLWDTRLGLGACGDWCLGRRVEDAWQSGRSLAAALLP